MALVTVQRSPSPSNTPETGSEDLLDCVPDSDSSLRSPLRSRRSRRARKRFRKAFHGVRFIHRLRFSESYLAVKGAALILPQSECLRTVTKSPNGGDIQVHLQSMFYLLRQTDTIKVAVKLECTLTNYVRYMVVVSTIGRQDTEESVILGIDIVGERATIGLVLPIWGDMDIPLDGDGGFSVTTNNARRNFKPVSVQAMWSVLQSLIKARDNAHQHSYHPNGLTHTWVSWYRVNSDQTYINEWNRMDDLESLRTDSVDESSDKAQLEKSIKTKLKEIMMVVDLEEVTSKFLRVRLEEEMGICLKAYRQYIDEEMIVILRQMDFASEIFDFLYLGSEWNASNLEELQANGVGYILNITREIDNFFPGMFEYMNIRVFDNEKAELMKYWDNTYKFISKARSRNSKVLIHCKMGVSRSASTVIAFAMKEFGWSLDQALNHVKQKRSCIKPNAAFMQQLVTYQGILDASKQRHNQLWRSMSASHLEDLSLAAAEEGDDTHSLQFFDINSYATPGVCRPRSWSPDDSTAQLLLKTQDLASDNESSDEHEEDEDICADEEPDFDLEFGPHLYPIENWEYSSRSADSLDEDFFLETSSPDPQGMQLAHSGPPVVLVSFRRYSQSSEDGDYPDNVTEDSDLDEESAQETQVKVDRGFYDVSMLTAEIEVPGGCLGPEELELNWDYVHPDVKIEAIMAQQRKHRRIAQLLKLSQPQHTNKEGIDILRPSAGKPGDSKVPLVPPNTPLCTKLKPDNYWIKEIPPSPQEAQKEGIACDGEESEPPDVEMEITADLQSLSMCSPAVTISEIKVSSEQTDQQVPLEDLQDHTLLQDTGIADADNDAQTVFPEHYEREEIPWNPGTVKRQTQDLEEKIKSELTVSETRLRTASSSSTGSTGGSAGDNPELLPEDNIPDSCLMGDSTSPDKSPALVACEDLEKAVDPNGNDGQDECVTGKRPWSIYDSEEIPLEPGLVQRTKQEFEQRERSHSLLDASPPVDSKPVQRSSSLKTERQASRKDRNSERRKTCLPVLRPSPPKEEFKSETRAKSQEPSDILACGYLDIASGLEKNSQHSEELRQRSKSDTSLKVYLVGTETFEVEEGKVQKYKRDFELIRDTDGKECPPKESESLLTLPAVDATATDRSPSPMPDEGLPIPTGSVKRQTQEIEEKYGTVCGPVPTSNTNAKPSEIVDEKDISAADTAGPVIKDEASGSCSQASPEYKLESSHAKQEVPMHTKESKNVKSQSKGDIAVNSEQGTCETAQVDGNTGIETKDGSLVGAESVILSNGEAVMNCATPTTGAMAYSEDDITWSVGTVRQHKEILESKAKELATPLPPKKLEQGDPRYRMSPQTLKLIREVGSLFLSSPSKGSEGDKSPGGGGLVRKLARDIEDKSGECVRKRLIIIEKDTKVNTPKKVLSRSNSESVERDITSCINNVERSSSFKENIHSKKRSPQPVEITSEVQSSKSVSALLDIQDNNQKDTVHKKSSPSEVISKDFFMDISHCKEDIVMNNETSLKQGDLVNLAEVWPSDDSAKERIIVRDLVDRFEPKDGIKSTDISAEMVDKADSSNLIRKTSDSCKKSPPRDSQDRHSAGAKLMAAASLEDPALKELTSETKKTQPDNARTRHSSERHTPEKNLSGLSMCNSPLPKVPSGHSRISPGKHLAFPLTGRGTFSARPRTSTDPCDPSTIPEVGPMEHEEDLKGRRLSLSDLHTSPAAKKGPTKSKSSTDIKTPGSSAGLNRVPISPQREPDPSAPRRQRKQHGKTHPLSRLSGDPNSGPEPSGRSRNPFYNTM